MNTDIKTLIESEAGVTFNRSNKCCCMFHSEDTPSFSVDVKKGIWKCFGCGVGGDAIQFLRDYKGLSYIEACKQLDIEIDQKYKHEADLEEQVKGFIEWQIKNIEAYKEFELIKLYKFADSNGDIKYFKAKFKTEGKKQLRYYSFEDGKVKCKRGSAELPYNLPNVLNAVKKGKLIFVVEGEKDVDALGYLGRTATSFKGVTEFSYSVLSGAKIYAIADTGRVGKEYLEIFFYNAKEFVTEFNVIELKGLEKLGDNKDVSDWLENGGTKGKLNAAIKDCWDWKKSRLYKYVVPSKDGKSYVPMRIWENLELLLKRHGIALRYNQLSKEIEYHGIDHNGVLGANAKLEDIYSLCQKERFLMGREVIFASIDRIAKEHPYNPVTEYLEECYKNWDGKRKYINMLAETLGTELEFSEDTKKLLLTKWLLNCANIAFNKDGDKSVEGILVIQGKQGIGKTRWIKSIIPNAKWVKTGLDLDPSDKDKIIQATKYWVSELGELDATMKKDQAKLKAFFTESVDELRMPYAKLPEKFNRLTCFYATVNKEEFLKDETGSRRYWVIPVQEMLVEHNINIDQLWGEVMYLLRSGEIPIYLTEEEKEMLEQNNESFQVKTESYLKLESGFDWSEADTSKWQKLSSSQVCDELGIVGYSTLKTELSKFGITQKRTNGKRFYLLPPFSDELLMKKSNKSYL